MADFEAIQLGLSLTWLAFILAFGFICGSFINVLVYRLPRGLGIITPPSACTACGTRLTWRENFPVFGWLWLRGRCRFCRTKISIEYPLIELLVGVMFAGLFMLWLMDEASLRMLGMDVSGWRPEWAFLGASRMWPMLLLGFALVGSLVAVTLIDARTFTIPLAIPWFMTVAGFVVHPLHAAWIGTRAGSRLPAMAGDWTIPTVDGPWIGASLGGLMGIGLSVLLLHFRLFPRSFSDYEQWEAGAQEAIERAKNQEGEGGSQGASPQNGIPLRLVIRRTLLLTGPTIALMFLGFTLGLRLGRPMLGWGIGLGVGLTIGAFLRRVGEGASEHLEPMWVQYPHARREMLKEIIYLLPCIGLAMAGWWIASRIGDAGAPLWLRALGGSVMGYLVGGGVVWLFRILGSLAFGKEAMGLGDVHLMAGVGAILGWIDPVIVFFIAPFLGVAWFLAGAAWSTFFRREGTALPYGPHLAAATLMVLYARPIFEQAIALIANQGMALP